MSNIQISFNILRSKSLRYVLFRLWLSFQKKMGLLQYRFPTVQKPINTINLNEWRARKRMYFFDSRQDLQIPKDKSAELSDAMSHLIAGDVLFFNKAWRHLGMDYNWVTNPVSGYEYDIHQHWSKIETLSEEAGDIKFTWEKSRFSWLLTICRYDYHFDGDHSEYVFSQILDWIEKNPLNCGPNYKCSQETSIRLQNWVFALVFYKYSDALTDERWNRIITSIYWQIHHIFNNINYSRIAVRNNHAITETLTLYLMGLLFPEMPGAKKWERKGKRWFEQEISYQLEEDGTFIQDRMNYHRVVIQLLTYAIAIADAHRERYADVVYERAFLSLNFLFQCQEQSNGWLPNYGANDGALFFPLSTADFRDYRPQLDALHGLLTGEPLYGGFLEDAKWVGHTVPAFRKRYPTIKKQNGIVRFSKSGYFLIREPETLTFFRCGLFKNNGSTDQLHLDIWCKGENVLIDGGSYLYNTQRAYSKYFNGTESHNTIMLDEYDQMLKGPRFMWFYPPKVKRVTIEEKEDSYHLKGEVLCFSYIGDNILVEREVVKKKRAPEWVISDRVFNKPESLTMRQLWHTIVRDRLIFESDGEEKHSPRWYSSYYGIKEDCEQIEFDSSSDSVITTIKIKD